VARVCANCNRVQLKGAGLHQFAHVAETRFKLCDGCMATYYCSSWCQKTHWRFEHKYRCRMAWMRRRAEF
jgi:hypothetical protein